MEEGQDRRYVFRVGVFVLVGLVVFIGVIYALGARARLFEPRYTIHAEFTEVGGLTEGATVRLAGVQIGRVTGVHLPAEPGGKVRVDLTIAEQFSNRVREDSVARIETQGLLGDRIIELTVGTGKASPVPPGGTIEAREATDIGRVVSETGEIVANVGALAESLRQTAETLNQSRIIEEAAATVTAARRATERIGQVTDQVGRVVDQVERGSGWAHVLIYEEPVALRRLNALVASTQALVERVQRGEGAAGVLTSAESTAAARRFVAAMERMARAIEQPGEGGVLPALLLDPQYRGVLDDLRVMSRNLREVSDRLAGGKGTLGGLLKDEPADAKLAATTRDLHAAVANLREITEKINAGDGTLGALIADPTVYERLVTILDGAQRSFLLRGLLRGLGNRGEDAREDARPSGRGDRRQ
ncbi:MAG TPA: MlaD family protein [Candidatus Tectomicrobia bacterium]|nr:MlaD family protein [Candidatus Tectomicrobia bacterium]